VAESESISGCYRLTELRYEDDCPDLYGSELSSEEKQDRFMEVRRKHLAQSLRITPQLAPAIWGAIERVRDRIVPGARMEAYLYNAPETQAFSFPGLASDAFVMGMASGLIKLVSLSELEFVIGHELGHCVFGHTRYADPNSDVNNVERLNLLALQRAAEISADRAGYVACGDRDVACRAILKVASGLSDDHLRYDIVSYLDQGREFHELGGSESELMSTHPIFTSRMKALLWFEMSDLYHAWSGRKDKAPIATSELNRKVRAELASANGFRLGNINEQALRTTLLWGAMCLFTMDNRLTKPEQAFLRRIFGDETAGHVIDFVKANGIQPVGQKFRDRLRDVVAMPRNVRELFYEDLESFASVAGGEDELKLNWLREVTHALKLEREVKLVAPNSLAEVPLRSLVLIPSLQHRNESTVDML